MTKKDIMEMIKDMDDNEKVMFVMDDQDREGFWKQYKTNEVVGIVAENAKPIGKFYGNEIYVNNKGWKIG